MPPQTCVRLHAWFVSVHVLPLSLTTMLPRSRSFDRSVLTTLSSIGEQWGAWHGHGGERLCNRALPLIHAAPNVCTLACVVCVGACAPLSLTTMLPRSRSFDRSVLTTLSSIGEQWGAWHRHGGERLCNRALPLIHAAPNVCTLACVVCVECMCFRCR